MLSQTRFSLAAALAAITVAALPLPAAAQTAAFFDPGAIDAEVQAFAGAAIGADGGARAPVDRRLRLAACAAPLQLSWQGRRADMVKVECSASASASASAGAGAGWRIFVPMAAGNASAPAAIAAAASAPAAVQVQRGQVLTIALVGRGFTVTQQGEALDEGAIGDWIRVRPEGNRESVRARIDNPGRVVIPMG